MEIVLTEMEVKGYLVGAMNLLMRVPVNIQEMKFNPSKKTFRLTLDFIKPKPEVEK